MENLTVQDINTLIDAMSAWEHKDMAGDLMIGLLDGIDKSQTKEERDAKNEKRFTEMRRKTEARQEESILLKAKLIALRGSIATRDAGSILNQANKQT